MTITDVMTTDVVLVGPDAPRARPPCSCVSARSATCSSSRTIGSPAWSPTGTSRCGCSRTGSGPDAPIRSACTAEPVALTPDAEVQDAVALMREYAVRRVPVCEDDGRVLGIVTLGNLAISEDGRPPRSPTSPTRRRPRCEEPVGAAPATAHPTTHPGEDPSSWSTTSRPPHRPETRRATAATRPSGCR